MSLTQDVIDAINDQIANEMFGAYAYLALSLWFDAQALEGFAHWLGSQSAEELQHAEKLIRFLRDHDAPVRYRSVSAPPQQFDSIEAALQTVIEIEERNTRQIHAIYHLALEQACHSAEVLMRWFIEQQAIEEKFARQTMARVKLAGDDRGALLVLDQQFGRGEGL